MGNQVGALQDALSRVQRENRDLKKEVDAIKKELQRQKDEYEGHVQKATEIVQRSQEASKRVVVLLGPQGSGKTTLNQYLFEVQGAEPKKSERHGTVEFHRGYSKVLDAYVVDTIGKVPDLRGMMRVLACVYNKGWDPIAIIVVHTGRISHLDIAASYLQASKINVIDFSPKPFYKALLKKKRDVDDALDDAIGDTEEVDAFRYVHGISLPDEPGDSIHFEKCRITENLVDVLPRLKWGEQLQAAEDEGIANSLAYYLAKSIAERAVYGGSDLDFIDRA